MDQCQCLEGSLVDPRQFRASDYIRCARCGGIVDTAALTKENIVMSAFTYCPFTFAFRTESSPAPGGDAVEIVLIDAERGRQHGLGVKGASEEDCIQILRRKLARDLQAYASATETDGTTYP